MKTIKIINVLIISEKEKHSGLRDIEIQGMDESEDSINILDASDGYHTFTELYDHRITLFIALCKQLRTKINADNINGVKMDEISTNIWRSKLHADGSMFDGWFIMGINKKPGKVITYHLPLSRWDETNFAETLDNAPEWDGHTSADILERLKVL